MTESQGRDSEGRSYSVLSYRPHSFLLAAAIALFACVSIAAPPTLDSDPRFREMYKRQQVLNDRPSMDTAPLFFSFGKVKYKIPRNYIMNMSDWWTGFSHDDGNLVRMRVTFPGFEPLTEKTKDCLTKPPGLLPHGCVPINFWMTFSGNFKDSSPTGLTDEEKFKNSSKLFHSQIPKPGPNGLELYETGPDNARIETYHKKTADYSLFVHCGLIHYVNGKRQAICDNHGSLMPQGGAISYQFYLDQIKDAEAIDKGLRKLVNSFIISGAKP